MDTHRPDTMFFHGANGIHIERSTFNEIRGNYNHNDYRSTIHNHSELGWNTLSSSIASGAIFNAVDRSDAAKCHPDTRTELLDIIKGWFNNPHHTSDILWLHGPAGVGKTAIAQSIAEWAYGENRLGGTFFFLHGKPEQEDARYLFPTLAYQLALQNPDLRSPINHAMSIDPTLPSKDLNTQLRSLIIRPFEESTSTPQAPLLVVLDGVDECQSSVAQEAILQYVSYLVGSHQIPLRFLIASRPEVQIRETFDTVPLLHQTRRIVLDRQFDPDQCIRTLFKDGFSRIYSKMQNPSLTSPWPSPEVIETLVAKSSGQFIYASTVLKFVGADWHIPTEQLEIVLNASPRESNLFQNLGELYTQILKRCPYRDDLIRVLALMLCFHCPQPPEVYDDILGFSHGRTSQILRGMHSLVKFPNEMEDAPERARFNLHQEYDQTCGLRLHHASFSDFLIEPTRAVDFFIDLPAMHAELVKAGFGLFFDCMTDPWSQTPRSTSPRHETWGYLKNHMTLHLSKCGENVKEAAIQSLENFKPNFSVATPITGTSWTLAFDALHSLVTTLLRTITCRDELHAAGFLHSEHSHWTQDITFESILPFDRDLVPDKALLELSLKYCKVLDDFYHFTLSESPTLTNLLLRLPGLMTTKEPFPLDCMEDIFGLPQSSILAELEQNRVFLHRWESLFWSHVPASNGGLEVVCLNPHMFSFLSDPSRSRRHYQRPEDTHVNACRNLIRLISSPEWLQTEKKDGALSCLEKLLKLHLDTVNVDHSTIYPDDHPMIALIVEFGFIIRDISSLETAPTPNVQRLWSATRRILDWLQRQRSKIPDKGPQSRRFEDLFVRANTQIYSQILQIQSADDGQSQTITLYTPFLPAVGPRRSLSPPTPSLHADGVAGHGGPPCPIRISEALLALHALRPSLLEFLTQQTSAGPFYIPAPVYHTQFAEICLDHCNPLISDITSDWHIPAAHAEWRFHLSRAQPSARLFEQLQRLGPGRWLGENLANGAYVKENHVKSISGIIRWLELSNTPPGLLECWRKTLRDTEGTEQRRTLVRRPKQTRIGKIGKP